MSAEILRRAAALMRERAKAVENPDGEEGTLPWREEWGHWSRIADTDALYIASLHPAVALAVADLLDVLAAYYETATPGALVLDDGAAIALARAYLGESA